jgi:hypothetical protein
MLAFKLQTPVNHTEVSIQDSEQGESLKSRTLLLIYFFIAGDILTLTVIFNFHMNIFLTITV